MKKLIYPILYLFFSSFSFAGLTVIPARQEVFLPVGEKFEGEYVVTNDYDVPIILKVEPRDWFVLPENKDKGITVNDWLEVHQKEFRLVPKESKPVRYTVKVSSAAVGSLVAMLSFIPTLETAEQPGVTLIISVSLFVIIKGTEKIDWEILNPKIEYRENKVQVSVEVKNNGNVHLRPTGSIKFLDKKNNTTLELEFKESRPVYPGQKRSVVAFSDNINFSPGKYKGVIQLSCYEDTKIEKIYFRVDRRGNIIFLN